MEVVYTVAFLAHLNKSEGSYCSHPDIGRVATGKNIWKMTFFPSQGKVREFCGWPGKFRKDLESQGKVMELENKWLWQAVFRKF